MVCLRGQLVLQIWGQMAHDLVLGCYQMHYTCAGNIQPKTGVWGNWKHFSCFPRELQNRHFICYSHSMYQPYHPSHTCTCIQNLHRWEKQRTAAQVENACDTNTHTWSICFHVLLSALSVLMCKYNIEKMLPGWGVLKCHTYVYQLEPHLTHAGTRNQIWLLLNQWFPDDYCSLWLF